MNSQSQIPDPIREEIELARALTALLMAVKLHCADSDTERANLSQQLRDPSRGN